MVFTIKIGGVPIEVHHQYAYIREYCRDYLTDDAAAFSVAAAEDDIRAEMQLSGGMFPPDMCESTCLHREIVKGLLRYGLILIHSAVIAVDKTAYVFTAKSGVGKSTHIGLWQAHFGSRATVVNGDKPMFSMAGGTLMVHGSPWRGKEELGENISLPVGGICFLERGDKTEISRASGSDIVSKLFHQVLLPDTASDFDAFMAILQKIVETVPFYNLRCTMEEDAARIAYEGMHETIPLRADPAL